MDMLRELVLILIPMILCLTVHEYCHARAALWLGDDTAAHLGRLTLNPLPHIDPVGTLLLPAMGVLSGGGFFGWARPVPVNPVRFTRPIHGKRVTMRTGMAITALAGPAANVLFGFLSTALLRLFVAFDITTPGLPDMLERLIMVNYVLAVFNLIPLPPLDGASVLMGLLPVRFHKWFEFLERNMLISMVLLVALISLNAFDFILGPLVKGLLWISFSLLQFPTAG